MGKHSTMAAAFANAGLVTQDVANNASERILRAEAKARKVESEARKARITAEKAAKAAKAARAAFDADGADHDHPDVVYVDGRPEWRTGRHAGKPVSERVLRKRGLR